MRPNAGCTHMVELVFVVVCLNLGTGLAAWWLGASPLVGTALLLGGGVLILSVLAAFDSWMDTVRLRRMMARIRVLDAREADDAEFDAAFAELRDAPVAWTREALRDDTRKSRRWFVALVAERRWDPEARALLRELAADWSDPVSERARAALIRSTP